MFQSQQPEFSWNGALPKDTFYAGLFLRRSWQRHLGWALQIGNQIAHFCVRYSLQETFWHHRDVTLGQGTDLVSGNDDFFAWHHNCDGIAVLAGDDAGDH